MTRDGRDQVYREEECKEEEREECLCYVWYWFLENVQEIASDLRTMKVEFLGF